MAEYHVWCLELYKLIKDLMNFNQSATKIKGRKNNVELDLSSVSVFGEQPLLSRKHQKSAKDIDKSIEYSKARLKYFREQVQSFEYILKINLQVKLNLSKIKDMLDHEDFQKDEIFDSSENSVSDTNSNLS